MDEINMNKLLHPKENRVMPRLFYREVSKARDRSNFLCKLEQFRAGAHPL
jgi:hypothetical protein